MLLLYLHSIDFQCISFLSSHLDSYRDETQKEIRLSNQANTTPFNTHY